MSVCIRQQEPRGLHLGKVVPAPGSNDAGVENESASF